MPGLGLYLGRLPGFDKRGFDRAELVECVRAADACGYDSFWMPEAWERDSFAVLTELALKTNRIGLGTGIVNVFSRSPALIAMSAATVDDISGGRFRLGLGTSGASVIEDFHGLKFNKPLTRLKESVAIIRALIAGERAELSGESFRVSRFKLGFKPVRPRLPIYIAALTPKSLRQLGEIADGWLPTHWPMELLREGIEEIHAGALAAGRDPNQIEIAPLVNVIVSDDRAGARARARLPIAYYVGGMGDFYHGSLSRLGYGAECDRVRESWQSGRRKEAIGSVTDEMVERIAVCGNVGEVRARLREMPRLGATLTVVAIPTEGTTAEKCRIIESLAV